MKSKPDLRSDAEKIWSAALRAADPGAAIQRALKMRGSTLRLAGQRYDPNRARNLWVLGAGKAAAAIGPRVFEQCRDDNNSYEFFSKLDDLIITCPTRTNVMDLRILLIGAPRSARPVSAS